MKMQANRYWVGLPLLILAACGGASESQSTAKLDMSKIKTGGEKEDGSILPPFGDATPAPVASQAATPPAAQGGGLSPGEYACYGSGGTVLAGLGFKLAANGGYTDLDGKERGTASVSGGTIKFSGGHMDGMEGRDIKGGKHFTIGSMASCELWG